jgi:hypothetical protein
LTKAPKDLGASMQARLRNLARQRGEDVQGLLMQFVLERLLHRLAASAHAGDFVLKGAMLFAAWTSTPHRATRDLDLHGTGSPSRERLVEVFRAVAATAVEPDGVTFLAATVRASRIRDDQPYQGIRVTLTAVMATARIGVQVDVGFGDAVHPAPVKLQYPSLLGLPTPRLRAYPREAVVAEKFHAMVALGELNSRRKDFYDLSVLAGGFRFDGARLGASIRATFDRRATDLPIEQPIAMRREFAALPGKDAQWRAFVRRSRLLDGVVPLVDVVGRLREFLWPIVGALVVGAAPPPAWQPGGPWR